jgi:hypothetical protein
VIDRAGRTIKENIDMLQEAISAYSRDLQR